MPRTWLLSRRRFQFERARRTSSARVVAGFDVLAACSLLRQHSELGAAGTRPLLLPRFLMLMLLMLRLVLLWGLELADASARILHGKSAGSAGANASASQRGRRQVGRESRRVMGRNGRQPNCAPLLFVVLANRACAGLLGRTRVRLLRTTSNVKPPRQQRSSSENKPDPPRICAWCHAHRLRLSPSFAPIGAGCRRRLQSVDTHQPIAAQAQDSESHPRLRRWR